MLPGGTLDGGLNQPASDAAAAQRLGNAGVDEHQAAVLQSVDELGYLTLVLHHETALGACIDHAGAVVRRLHAPVIAEALPESADDRQRSG